MTDFIIILLVAVMIGAIIFYIRAEKKKGTKCIGCPHAATCGKAGSCSGSCAGCSGGFEK